MFRFADLCSGIGGFRLGLEALGGRCVYSAERDRFARESYQANFRIDEPFDWNLEDRPPRDVPDHDLLAAGFPCQPFSTAGRRRGFSDDRGNVFTLICRIIEAKQPEFVLLENVPGLYSHEDGQTFQVILKTLSELGYWPEHRIVNAQSWVPQRRRRIFIWATKSWNLSSRFMTEQPPPIEHGPKLGTVLEWPVPKQYYLSDKMIKCLIDRDSDDPSTGIQYSTGIQKPYGSDDVARTITVKAEPRGSSVIAGDAEPIRVGQFGDGSHQWQRIYSTEGVAVCQQASDGGLGVRTGLYAPPDHVVKCEVPEGTWKTLQRRDQLHKERGNGFRTQIADPSKVAYTITARYGRDGFECLLPYKARPRMLTPLECARVSGFDTPDRRWKLHKSKLQNYRQFGNCVVPQVVEFVARAGMDL